MGNNCEMQKKRGKLVTDLFCWLVVPFYWWWNVGASVRGWGGGDAMTLISFWFSQPQIGLATLYTRF